MICYSVSLLYNKLVFAIINVICLLCNYVFIVLVVKIIFYKVIVIWKSFCSFVFVSYQLVMV